MVGGVDGEGEEVRGNGARDCANSYDVMNSMLRN